MTIQSTVHVPGAGDEVVGEEIGKEEIPERSHLEDDDFEGATRGQAVDGSPRHAEEKACEGHEKRPSLQGALMLA
jgi:hypothetical protein